MRLVLLSAGVALALFSGTASAQWSTGETANKASVYAGTANQSGALLSRYCHYKDQMCYWQIFNTLSCDPGESYPAMATSGVTAQITLVCEGKMGDGKYGYFMKPFDAVDVLIKKGGVLGVVMVSADDSFNVYRFNLSGATKAMTDADELFHQRRPTRDMRL